MAMRGRPYSYILALLLDAGCAWDEADTIARELGAESNP